MFRGYGLSVSMECRVTVDDYEMCTRKECMRWWVPSMGHDISYVVLRICESVVCVVSYAYHAVRER